MKKSDSLWIVILLAITSLIIIPKTRIVYEQLTSNYPYLMGFLKTAILASMGERLVHRMKTGKYFGDHGILMKGIVWGLLGMVFVLIFKVFASGVSAAQTANLLPAATGVFGSILTAFLISTIMNVFFAPTFMIFHRITDNYIELGEGKLKTIVKVPFSSVIDRIDFLVFFRFIVFITIPLFWIPAHTITFMLPEDYRVLMAAYLSIVLGILLSLKKGENQKK